MEIIAPVGNWEMLSAAINAGADSVYLGVSKLNMRATARNFELDELDKVVKCAHESKVEVYLTVNTIVFEDELENIEKILKKAKNAGVDAVIAWDLAVLKMARELDIPVHLSTQASASNSVAIEEYRSFGVEKVVLARECKLEEIKKISKKTDVTIEAFAHGAMCVSESGRCFMSQFLYGKSANRGDCIQPCRRNYIIKDPETGKELILENRHVMSAKDLCTIKFLDKLQEAGVGAIKIEGRARTPEYVDVTVRTYKKALEMLEKGIYEKHKDQLEKKLRQVYNRDFSDGFYMGRPITEFWDRYGGESEYSKKYLGDVLNYYKEAKAVHGKLNAGNLKVGDTIWIIGPTTGIKRQKITSLRNKKEQYTEEVKKGEEFTALFEHLVRPGDKIYKRVKNIKR